MVKEATKYLSLKMIQLLNKLIKQQLNLQKMIIIRIAKKKEVKENNQFQENNTTNKIILNKMKILGIFLINQGRVKVMLMTWKDRMNIQTESQKAEATNKQARKQLEIISTLENRFNMNK